MARTLTETLAAAIDAPSRRPAMQFTLRDGAHHYTRHRSDPRSAAANACFVDASGSLWRVDVSSERGVVDASVSYQRITDPSQASQWTAWTTLQNRVTGAAGVAAGVLPNGDVMVTYVTFTTVYRRTSSDDGATWGDPETLWNARQIVRAMCYGGNGSIFLAVDKSGGGVTVYRLHESDGTWQADEWTHGTYSACGGIGGTWDGTAWHLALSLWGGVPGTTGTSIMACRTAGATWEALTPIARVDDSTARRNLLSPTVEKWEQAFRVTYLERDYGVVSGLNFGRWRYCTAHTWGTFAEATPVEDESFAGFWWLRQDASRYWLVNHETAHAYGGYAATNPNQFQDASARVLDFQWQEQANETGNARLLLDNADRELDSWLGKTLQSGATLGVHAGYVTGAGVERVPLADLVVQDVALLPDSTVRIEAADASVRARRRVAQTWAYSGNSVRALLTEAWYRAGALRMTDDGDSRFDRVLPAFALHAGQAWQTMIDRLTALDSLRWRIEADGTVHCRFPGADATTWTYTGQEFVGAWQQRNRINHVLVQGTGVLGEAWDWDAVRARDSAYTALVTDTQLTQAADCQSRAEAVLAAARRDSDGYTVDVPYNPALQVGDVIDFQTPGFAYGKLRIVGISHRFTPHDAEYTMTLQCGELEDA
ncbi:MAG: hypothetical protein OXK81_10635 [Chloroflexota bacterium]|nr:hypothetical protein [Chloroflexota bacterium]